MAAYELRRELYRPEPTRRHLRGENPQRRKPAELPVEQPPNLTPVINLKTAKQIGLPFRRTCWRGLTE